MKKNVFILLIIVTYNNCLGQVNLVPNPSFETYSSCPTYTSQLYKSIPWYSPNMGTSDYYNICGSDSTGTGTASAAIPNNYAGYQYARTGNGCAGIGFDPLIREYLAIKLDSTLKPNKKYCVEYYVNLWNCSRYSTSSLGAYFSISPLTDYSTAMYFSVIPQIENPSSRLLSDTSNWMLISGSFIAAGGEQYLMIGNLLNDTGTVLNDTYPTNVCNPLYYYIDDVSVIECSEIPAIPAAELIIPSLIGGNHMLEIKGLQGTCELQLYNSLGQIVYKNVKYQNDLNVLQFDTGIYYYYLQLANGDVRKGKICIVN